MPTCRVPGLADQLDRSPGSSKKTCINKFGAFHNHLWDVSFNFALTELIHNRASKRQIFTITVAILRHDKVSPGRILTGVLVSVAYTGMM